MEKRITSRELAEAIGMTESMAEILRRHRLRWLARMEDSRMPKQLLFGELARTRPRHSTKRRWRDLAEADVQAVGLGRAWYEVAQDRKEWEEICRQCRASDSNKDGGHSAANSSNTNTDSFYPCSYGRSFQRQGDLTQHSRFCDGAQHQSHRETASIFDCPCGRTFRRQGDRTRHSYYCSFSAT